VGADSIEGNMRHNRGSGVRGHSNRVGNSGSGISQGSGYFSDGCRVGEGSGGSIGSNSGCVVTGVRDGVIGNLKNFILILI